MRPSGWRPNARRRNGSRSSECGRRAPGRRAAAAAPKVLVSLPINVGDAEHVLEVLEGEDPMAKLFEFCGRHMGTNAAAWLTSSRSTS